MVVYWRRLSAQQNTVPHSSEVKRAIKQLVLRWSVFPIVIIKFPRFRIACISTKLLNRSKVSRKRTCMLVCLFQDVQGHIFFFPGKHTEFERRLHEQLAARTAAAAKKRNDSGDKTSDAKKPESETVSMVDTGSETNSSELDNRASVEPDTAINNTDELSVSTQRPMLQTQPLPTFAGIRKISFPAYTQNQNVSDRLAHERHPCTCLF